MSWSLCTVPRHAAHAGNPWLDKLSLESSLRLAQCVQAYMSPPSLHSASINSLCWAPHELGLHLAAASSDGTVSTLTYQADGSWLANKV